MQKKAALASGPSSLEERVRSFRPSMFEDLFLSFVRFVSDAFERLIVFLDVGEFAGLQVALYILRVLVVKI